MNSFIDLMNDFFKEPSASPQDTKAFLLSLGTRDPKWLVENKDLIIPYCDALFRCLGVQIKEYHELRVIVMDLKDMMLHLK
jgi:hypothetical protein